MDADRSISQSQAASGGLGGADVRAIVARSAGGAFAVNLAGLGLGFALHVLLSRTLGVDHYGVYVYVLSWMTILALVATMGLDTALLRFVAAYAAGQEWGLLRGILGTGAGAAALASVLLAALGGAAVWGLQASLGSRLVETFWVGLALLPILVLLQLCAPVLRASARIVLALVLENILRRGLLAALIVLAFLALGWPARAPTAMALNLLAATAALVVGAWWVRRSMPPELAGVAPAYRRREWFAVAAPLLLISGSLVVLNQTDTVMIGAILGTREAGIYTAAARIALLVLLGLTAVNAIAAPMIARLHATGKRAELQRMVTFCARAVLAVSLPAAALVMVWGEQVLAAFGPAFGEGLTALRILAAGQLVNAAAGSVGFLMTMTGHQRQAAMLLGAAAALNVLLNALLIPPFGIEGAAAATATTIVLWNVALFAYVRRKLGIDASPFGVFGSRYEAA